MKRHNNFPMDICKSYPGAYGRQCLSCGIDTVTTMAMPVYEAPSNLRKAVRGRIHQSDEAYMSCVFYGNEVSRYAATGEYVQGIDQNINALTDHALRKYSADMRAAFATNGLRPKNLCRMDVFIDMTIFPNLSMLQSIADARPKKDKLRIVIGHNGIKERVLFYRGNGVWISNDGSDDLRPVSSDAACWRAITDRIATIYIGNKSRELCIYCKPRNKDQYVFRYETRFRNKRTLNRAAYGPKAAPASNIGLLKDIDAIGRVMSTAASIVVSKALINHEDQRPAYFVDRTLRLVVKERSRNRISEWQLFSCELQCAKTVEKLECLDFLAKRHDNNHISFTLSSPIPNPVPRHNGRAFSSHSPPILSMTMTHGGGRDDMSLLLCRVLMLLGVIRIN